jgi:hypothetical protein
VTHIAPAAIPSRGANIATPIEEGMCDRKYDKYPEAIGPFVA